MDTESTSDAVPGVIVPNDPGRPITYREFKILSDEFAARIRQEAARKRTETRDKILGWFFVIVFFSAIFWLAWSQVQSQQDLRRVLYDNCLATQQEQTDTARFYRQIQGLGMPTSKQFNSVLATAIKQLDKPRDCAAKYLNN